MFNSVRKSISGCYPQTCSLGTFSKLRRKDAGLESIRTRLPKVNCSQRFIYRAVCSPSHINPSNFTQTTVKSRLQLPRGALLHERFSHSLAEEIQLHRENTHRSSFHYCKLLLVFKWTNIFFNMQRTSRWEKAKKNLTEASWTYIGRTGLHYSSINPPTDIISY